MDLMPKEKVPLNYFIHPIVKSYYDIQEDVIANKLASELYEIYTEILLVFYTDIIITSNFNYSIMSN